MRLVGDADSYTNVLKESEQQTVETTNRISGLLGGLQSALGGAVSALGSFGITSWLNEAFHAWSEAEDVGISLRATLRANGREVDELADRYQRFASEMQELTTISDEATMTNLRMAESFGLTGSAAEQATRNAIGLARSANSSANAMMRLTAAMAEGDTNRAMMFSRMVPQLRGIRDEQEFVARFNRLVSSGFDAIAESADTGAGRLRALKEAYGDLMEDFGKQVAELLKPVAEVKLAVVAWFKGLSDGAKQAIVVLAGVAAAFLAIVGIVKVLGLLVTVATGGIAPIIGGIVAAGIAMVYWLSRFESIGKAWDYVKEKAGIAWDYIKTKATEFWAWIRPVLIQLWNIFVAGWEIVKSAAAAVWDFIVRVHVAAFNQISQWWRRFFGDFSVNWDSARDFILDTMIGMEFVLRKFGDVASLVWDTILLKFYQMVGGLEHWFTTKLPRLGQAWDAAWRRDLRGMTDALLPSDSARVMSERERQLQESIRRQTNILQAGYESFRRKRYQEFFRDDPEEDGAWQKKGEKDQENYNKGKKKEMEKFEAAARYSAEAVSRIYTYMERARSDQRLNNNQAEQRTMVAMFSPDAQQRIEQHNTTVVSVLRNINQELRIANERPQIVVENVELT